MGAFAKDFVLHLGGLAEGFVGCAWLQALAQCEQQLPRCVILEHLLQAYVCEPDGTPAVHCDHMRHEECLLPPAGQYFAYEGELEGQNRPIV